MSDVLDAAKGASDGARAAWAVLAEAPLPDGWMRELTSNGFIEHDLRFRRGDDWVFSAVLNDGWVLWYTRKPALRTGLVDEAAMIAAFPEARVNKAGEVLLRLHDDAQAQALWGWLAPAGQAA